MVIKFPASGELLAKIDKLEPARLLPVLAKTLDTENDLTVDHIKSKYLSFGKGEPPTKEGLRVQSNRYRQSLRHSNATITAQGLTSSIGTNIKNKGFSYPRLHEFGGTVTLPERIGAVRLKTDARGQLILRGGRLATFAKNTSKRAKVVAFVASAHSKTYPARAPIQRGINDRLPEYGKAFLAAINKEFKA